MIRGELSGDGEAIIRFELAGELQQAIIDLDFSGDLEMPEILRPRLKPQPIGCAHSLLSTGLIAEEALHLVVLPLLGEKVYRRGNVCG